MEKQKKFFKKHFKKNKNSAIDDNDPILQKKIKKNPVNKNSNLVNAVADEEKFQEENIEETQNQPILTEYENFLRKYKIKREEVLEKSFSTNVIKRTPAEIKELNLPRINFIDKIGYNSYRRHYHENYKNITNKIIEEEKNGPNNGKKNVDFLKDFSFKNIDENKKPKTEEEILNNNVKIRNYNMSKEYKRSKKEFCSYYFEKLILDKNAKEYIENEGIAKDPILHKKISHLLVQEEFDPEDLEILTFLNEYLDFIYLGNEENEFLKVIFQLLNSHRTFLV